MSFRFEERVFWSGLPTYEAADLLENNRVWGYNQTKQVMPLKRHRVFMYFTDLRI